MHNNINLPKQFRDSASRSVYYAIINAYQQENYRLLSYVNYCVDWFSALIKAHHQARPVLELVYDINNKSDGAVFITEYETERFFKEVFEQ